MGVAYVDWTARENMMHALKDKHRRQTNFADGCYKTRQHNVVDHGLHREDDIETTSLFELGRQSCTCEMLDPEEAMIQAEEAALLTEQDYTAEITDGSNGEPEEQEEPCVPSLADYYMQLFGITADDHAPLDETHLGICCEEPALQYRSRPVWATA